MPDIKLQSLLLQYFSVPQLKSHWNWRLHHNKNTTKVKNKMMERIYMWLSKRVAGVWKLKVSQFVKSKEEKKELDWGSNQTENLIVVHSLRRLAWHSQRFLNVFAASFLGCVLFGTELWVWNLRHSTCTFKVHISKGPITLQFDLVSPSFGHLPSQKSKLCYYITLA